MFVYGILRYQRIDRQHSREKFADLVRQWDVGQRLLGNAIAGIEYEPIKLGFWLRCTAYWRTPSGEIVKGSATL
jgi:hypothetical protein